MRPLLAHIYEPHRVTYPCYVQPKLNGIRALYQNDRFQSRDELPFPEGLLDHLARPLTGLFGPDVILDGELYHHGWPLQRINAAVTPIRQQPTEDTLLVEYHVFDRVHFGLSFWDRYLSVVEGLNKQGLHFVATWKANSEVQANRCYALAIEQGYEGMMYRLGDCPYTTPKQLKWEHKPQIYPAIRQPLRTKFLSDKDNRCWHLLKRKDWQDDEFTIIRVNEGEGKLRGMTGSFTCAIDKLSHPGYGKTFEVGSGLTDSERAHYFTNQPIGNACKTKYLVLSNDGIPLNPTILAIL